MVQEVEGSRWGESSCTGFWGLGPRESVNSARVRHKIRHRWWTFHAEAQIKLKASQNRNLKPEIPRPYALWWVQGFGNPDGRNFSKAMLKH